jgi:Na+-driven multidrug efflux pump
MGSAAIGGLIAHAAFWILLVRGYLSEEMGLRGSAIALALWATGLFALPYLPYAPPFGTYIAIIDIALVFLIFKGDVRLT